MLNMPVAGGTSVQSASATGGAPHSDAIHIVHAFYKTCQLRTEGDPLLNARAGGPDRIDKHMLRHVFHCVRVHHQNPCWRR